MMTKMRIMAMTALAATGFAIGAAPSAVAQSQYPVGAWCFAVHDNLTPNCSIPTYEQCDLQSLHGLHGECYRNPDYHPASRAKSRRRHRD